MANVADVTELKQTPLHDLHLELGARMVPFAGFEMPLRYGAGIIAEHTHTRGKAGLFDVSHMGQANLIGPDHATTALALESLTPSGFAELDPGRQRYTVLLNREGGIIDDLMVTRPACERKEGTLSLVVNASRKNVDFAYLRENLPDTVGLEVVEDRALISVQGPDAVDVVAAHAPTAGKLSFLSACATEFDGIKCHVSRSGYTGEDGVELSVPAGAAEAIACALLADERVEPIGLGARDSLRLEAGLCLYGQDLDETTSPAECNISFCIQKRRRDEGGFPGADRIREELKDGPGRLRVGLRLQGKVPAGEGAQIALPDGPVIGTVTSGGFAPTIGVPVAMGYVPPDYSKSGTELELIVRDRRLAATVTELPFVPNRYHRKSNP